MAMPSDAILAASSSWTTNARASDDYALDVNLPQFGGGAVLLWALGLRPSKDNFWTTNSSSARPPNYAPDANPGQDIELNAIVAALSTGPVGISDAFNATDVALVMRTCAADGTLLQPLRPPTPVDRSYARPEPKSQSRVRRDPGSDRAELATPPAPGRQTVRRYAAGWPGGRVWTAHAAAGAQDTHLTLSMDVDAPDLNLSASDFYPRPNATAWLHRDWHAPACVDGERATCVSDAWPSLTSTDRGDRTAFDLWLSYPADGAWVLLGELDKFVPLAAARFADASANATSCAASLRGAPGEAVVVTALELVGGAWTAHVHTATLDGDGLGEVIFS